MTPRQYEPEVRARAVARAEEVGASDAARELGLPANTVSSWLQRARAKAERERRRAEEQAAVDASLGEPIDPTVDLPGHLAYSIEAWLELAEAARRRSREMVIAGRGMDAKSLATTGGIAVDKARLLVSVEADLKAAHVQLEESEVDLLVAAFDRAVSRSGLDPLAQARFRQVLVAELDAVLPEALATEGAAEAGLLAELEVEVERRVAARLAAEAARPAVVDEPRPEPEPVTPLRPVEPERPALQPSPGGSVVAFGSLSDMQAGVEAATGARPGRPVGRKDVDGLAMDDRDRAKLERFLES